MRERWAITGAGGFIGRALIEQLLSEGIDVRALVHDSAAAAGVATVRGDVRDGEAVRQLVDGCEVVVHLAGYVHRPTRTADERAACWSINEGGTRTVIEAAAASATPAFVILISTANVYPISDSTLDEEAQVRPKTVYGESKLAAEQLLLGAVRAGRIRGAILRPAMVFGAAAPGNLARLAAMLRRGLALRFRGGCNRKSVAPVELVVDSIMAVARERERTNGAIYNVAGATYSMAELQELISSAIGARPMRLSLPAAPFLLAGRLLDLLLRATRLPSVAQLVETLASSAAISDAKLRALPSFRSAVNVEEALRTAVRAPLRTKGRSDQ
jgi:nucleoside-diphosphate-sugar epimerase